jgi:hypothetical protein
MPLSFNEPDSLNIIYLPHKIYQKYAVFNHVNAKGVPKIFYMDKLFEINGYF